MEACEPDSLAPNLAKIILLAERKGGTVSGRDITLGFDSKHRPSKERIKEWLDQLATMNYGEVTTKRLGISFTVYPRSTVSTLDLNQDTANTLGIHTSRSTVSTVSTLQYQKNDKSVDKCGYTVDHLSTPLEPLPDKSFVTSVDTVDTKTPPSENLETLMMSCVTGVEGTNNQKPTPKSKPKTAKNKTLKLGERVVVADPELPIYHGQKGIVISVCYVRDGQEGWVRFDEKVRGIETGEFLTSQLMLATPFP